MLACYQVVLPFKLGIPEDPALHFPYEGRRVTIRPQHWRGERILSYTGEEPDWLEGIEDGHIYTILS